MGMDLAPNAPKPPSFDPMLQASLQTFNTDMAAYENLSGTSTAQREFGADLAGAAATQSQDFTRMATDAAAWGRQMFNNIWPYALNYLTSQQSLSTLAGENASQAIIDARTARDRANKTYQDYEQQFAPITAKFAQEVTDYADPLNAQRMAGRARADARAAGDAALARQRQEMESHDIDPSEAKHQGISALSGLQTAAMEAGAGTNAYEEQRKGAIGLLGQAAQFGQSLPKQAMEWLQSAAAGAQSAIGTAGQLNPVPSLSGLLTAGTTAGGSPTAYGYIAGNPYTTLSGQQTQAGSSALGYATNLIGSGLPNVINAASGAQSSFGKLRQDAFKATNDAEAAAWGGLMKGIGGIGSALMTPMSTVTGSVGASMLGSLFPASDRRLKEDIKPIGRVGSLPMYSFRYKGSPVRQVGYMADEVEQVDPRAVVMHPSGYKAVNYAQATISALGG